MYEISLRQLKVFVVVAATQNLGLAAAQLYLSRGAVSQALKALEDSLGMLLFDRQAQRLQLNSAGRQLLPLAHEMLARQQQIQQLFRRSHRLAVEVEDDIADDDAGRFSRAAASDGDDQQPLFTPVSLGLRP